MLSEMVKIKL